MNHPETHPPTAIILKAYGSKPPEMVPVDITNATVATVARRLSGPARPGGVDLVSLQHWLLLFEAAIVVIRQIIREFEHWMANSRPPWVVYRSLILGRLIGLNKFPGVRLVRVGETWRRMLEKCVLAVTGAEDNKA